MKRKYLVSHEFVDLIPNVMSEGVVYISTKYATAQHMCCCGCGNKVVTPFSPQDWRITYDGESISINPSIGNWGFACRSHYWIRDNRVEWSRQFAKSEIELVRRRRNASGNPENLGEREPVSPLRRLGDWLKEVWVRES